MPIKTIITCDTCGDEIELTGPYYVAKIEMKEAGFRNIKIDNEWKIQCGKCRGKK